MSLAVVVALWQRPLVTYVALNAMRRSAQAATERVHLFAVTDEEDNGRMARALGFEVVTAPNQPLSDKHNAGLAAARELGKRINGVVVMGSDDLVTQSFFERYALRVSPDKVFGLRDTYTLCLRSWRTAYFPGYEDERKGEPIGTGRFIGRRTLEALDWRLWEPGLSRGLDRSQTRLLAAAGRTPSAFSQRAIGVRVLGVKTRHVLTPFRVNGPREETDLDEVLGAHHPLDIALLQALRAAGLHPPPLPATQVPRRPPLNSEEYELWKLVWERFT